MKTNAHPGHSETAYFRPVPMRDIQVQVKGAFRSARAIRSNQDLPLTHDANYTGYGVPELEENEAVALRRAMLSRGDRPTHYSFAAPCGAGFGPPCRHRFSRQALGSGVVSRPSEAEAEAYAHKKLNAKVSGRYSSTDPDASPARNRRKRLLPNQPL